MILDILYGKNYEAFRELEEIHEDATQRDRGFFGQKGPYELKLELWSFDKNQNYSAAGLLTLPVSITAHNHDDSRRSELFTAFNKAYFMGEDMDFSTTAHGETSTLSAITAEWEMTNFTTVITDIGNITMQDGIMKHISNYFEERKMCLDKEYHNVIPESKNLILSAFKAYD